MTDSLQDALGQDVDLPKVATYEEYQDADALLPDNFSADSLYDPLASWGNSSAQETTDAPLEERQNQFAASRKRLEEIDSIRSYTMPLVYTKTSLQVSTSCTYT